MCVTLSRFGNLPTGTLLLFEDSPPLLTGVKEYMFYLLEYLYGDLNVELFLPNVLLSSMDLFDKALWCLALDGVRISFLKFFYSGIIS